MEELTHFILHPLYEGIGLVDITAESHFDVNHIPDEIYEFSREHELYEICDESFIVCQNGKKEFYGDVYKFTNGTMTKAGTGKILLLGDSLRMGYEPFVRKMLEDKAYVGGPDENGRWAAYTLNSLRFWLGQFPEPDVIHWNNGLWDLGDDYQLGRPFSLPEEYESALERTITVLNKLFPKARIIMATTMPTDNPDSSDTGFILSAGKYKSDVHASNVNEIQNYKRNITFRDCDFFTYSRNLFDNNTTRTPVEVGYLNYNDYTWVTDSTVFTSTYIPVKYSDYIKVSSHTNGTKGNLASIIFYDNNKKIIGTISDSMA